MWTVTSRWGWCIVGLAALAGALCLGLAYVTMPSDQILAAPNHLPEAGDPGREYPMMAFDAPPIEDPVLVPADEAAVEEEDVVIGILVNGEPRAYLRDAFNGSPFRHVVSDTFASTSVAITHCDRVHCTRVFISPEEGQELEMRIGGWRQDQTMELIVNDEGYSQKSKDIPLSDLPFLELPWGEWRELFPETLIYLGESGSASLDTDESVKQSASPILGRSLT